MSINYYSQINRFYLSHTQTQRTMATGIAQPLYTCHVRVVRISLSLRCLDQFYMGLVWNIYHLFKLYPPQSTTIGNTCFADCSKLETIAGD